jgi:hypothetical protein
MKTRKEIGNDKFCDEVEFEAANSPSHISSKPSEQLSSYFDSKKFSSRLKKFVIVLYIN